MATTATSKSTARPLEDIDGNNFGVGTSSTANKNAKKPKTAAAPSSNKIFTFSFDASPAQIQLLSNNTVYDLVDIAFKVCNPRPYNETASDHLWDIKIANEEEDAKEALTVFSAPHDFPVSGPRADETKIDEFLASADLNNNKKLRLNYDYGSTSFHTFILVHVEEASRSLDTTAFPRRKPEVLVTTTFSETAVDLDKEYKALGDWIFPRKSGTREVNLFQAGRKPH